MNERHIDVEVSIDDDVRAHADLPIEWEEARPLVEKRFWQIEGTVSGINQAHRSHEKELGRLHSDSQNMWAAIHNLLHQIQQANHIVAERLHKMEYGLMFGGLLAFIIVGLLVLITGKLY